jgi:hypothetical protein
MEDLELANADLADRLAGAQHDHRLLKDNLAERLEKLHSSLAQLDADVLDAEARVRAATQELEIARAGRDTLRIALDGLRGL